MKKLCIFQAIAHYEQAADYYKGEESNRSVLAADHVPTIQKCLVLM